MLFLSKIYKNCHLYAVYVYKPFWVSDFSQMCRGKRTGQTMTLNLCHLLEVIENYIKLFIFSSWIFFYIARKRICNLNRKCYLYNYYKQYHNTKTEMKEGTFKNLFHLNCLVHKNKEISIYDWNVEHIVVLTSQDI